MNKHPNVIHPHHCFCQVPEPELLFWMRKRYVEGISTIELINSTEDSHEREVISIVSMLDLDEDEMLELMGDVEKPVHHIVHCREKLKQMLNFTKISQT